MCQANQGAEKHGARAMRIFVTIALLLLAAVADASGEGRLGSGLAAGPITRKQWLGDFDGMVKRRFMRVLVVENKTHYYVDRGRQRGLTYEAFKRVEEEINRELPRKEVGFHVVFVPVSRTELLPRLVDGFGDVAAANLTITPERRKIVDFTRPVFAGVSEIVVTGPQSPPMASLDDLSGQEIFVRKSSAYYESLPALNEELRAKGKAGAVLKPAPDELEDEDLLEMLNAGLVKVAVVDSHMAEFWSQIFDRIRPRPDLALRAGGEIAWAIRKQSPKLEAELNAVIARHGQGKAFANDLFRRYLKSARYVKNAASEAELQKFQQVVALFRKYGDQYGLDPLLIAAQGYQESRLDQGLRSHRGAVGVMQVMPSLGKELRVGDINLLDPNVHAGVKYIRFMIDEHYADQPMTPLDKELFAFASYNAGPARIERLRHEAQRRGLDPNVWFNNVELVASEKIGRETVQYVSNIYKYYVAYTLVEQARAAKEAAKRKTGAGAAGSAD